MPRRRPDLAPLYDHPYRWDEKRLSRIISAGGLLDLLEAHPGEWFRLYVDGKPELVLESKRIVPHREVYHRGPAGELLSNPPGVLTLGPSSQFRARDVDDKGYPKGYRDFVDESTFLGELYPFIELQMSCYRNMTLEYPRSLVPPSRLDRLTPPRSPEVMVDALVRERQGMSIYVDGACLVDVDTLFTSPRRYCFFIDSHVVTQDIGRKQEYRNVRNVNGAHMGVFTLKRNLVEYLDHMFMTEELRGRRVGCVMHPARELG